MQPTADIDVIDSEADLRPLIDVCGWTVVVPLFGHEPIAALDTHCAAIKSKASAMGQAVALGAIRTVLMTYHDQARTDYFARTVTVTARAGKLVYLVTKATEQTAFLMIDLANGITNSYALPVDLVHRESHRLRIACLTRNPSHAVLDDKRDVIFTIDSRTIRGVRVHAPAWCRDEDPTPVAAAPVVDYRSRAAGDD